MDARISQFFCTGLDRIVSVYLKFKVFIKSLEISQFIEMMAPDAGFEPATK